MRRRSLFGGLAAVLGATRGFWPFSPLEASARVSRRLRPSDRGWPDAAAWGQLKDAVGGRLFAGHSLFAACQDDPGGARCADVESLIRNPFYIGDQDGGTQVSGWLDAWAPSPSPYVVEARQTSDVVAAVNFARQHNLLLVVKGAGHSYQGT